jgi:hypothetical protein
MQIINMTLTYNNNDSYKETSSTLTEFSVDLVI